MGTTVSGSLGLEKLPAVQALEEPGWRSHKHKPAWGSWTLGRLPMLQELMSEKLFRKLPEPRRKTPSSNKLSPVSSIEKTQHCQLAKEKYSKGPGPFLQSSP